ncbi:DUF2207 domain-containing protein [Dictyobacter arantiisoli]|uniref:DUF2207 domain-containing protein n=1 Tax=Dictyobacter arantiisoli TaxID=2014874 RepID=A0A5A5T5J6_9CHLR|nr:DUF2207 domain-containing protein [Dictyobacter arantiisoli]GCF06632.1 hypothetical protein KDI_01960 [Dictyobacter arantiisoli]
MIRKLFIVSSLFIILFFALIHPSLAQTANEYAADQFTASISIQNDSSLLITETTVFHFIRGTYTSVNRPIATNHTENVTIANANMDGKVVARGDATGQYSVTGTNPLRVMWHFAPTSNSTHTFSLTYRAKGVFTKTATSDFLGWEAIPASRNYVIHDATITVSYPNNTQIVGPPEVVKGPALVVHPLQTGSVVYKAKEVDADDPIDIGIDFHARSLITSAPHWQTWKNQADNYFLPCFSGAIILGVIIALALFLYTRKQQSPVTLNRNLTVTEPPDDLTPALSGTLVTSPTRGDVHYEQVLGTLFNLANRGVLSISEQRQTGDILTSTIEGADAVVFCVNLLTEPADLKLYEAQLLKILFHAEDMPSTALTFTDIFKRYLNGARQFDTAVQQTIAKAGLLDLNYVPLRKRLRQWSVLLISVGLGASALGFGIGIALNIWPIGILPMSLILAGIIALFIRAYCRRLSPQGVQTTAQWQAFDKYLQSIILHKSEPEDGQDIFMRYLPYATSFTWGISWVEHFQEEIVQNGLPAWFQRNTDSNDTPASDIYLSNSAALIALMEQAYISPYRAMQPTPLAPDTLILESSK